MNAGGAEFYVVDKLAYTEAGGLILFFLLLTYKDGKTLV